MNRPFIIVLVRPRDPNNIGAASRAMANFGLTELRVVEPWLPTWRAAVSAVGAQDILENAALYNSLPEALADCRLTVATTALKNRKLGQNAVMLPDFPAWLTQQGAGKTALVFGNEKTGLSNEDILLCSAVMHIPTQAKQPSVNLAQAVTLTCYELARTRPDSQIPPSAPVRATFEQTEIVLDEIELLMRKSQIKTDYTPAQRKSILRALLRGSNLSENDLFFLRTFAQHLHQRLQEEPHAQ